MEYLELSLAVRPDAVEAAADILRRFVPAGVSIEPEFEPVEPEEGIVAFDETAPVRLRAWLPEDGAASHETVDLLREELRALGDAVARPLRQRAVRDAAWASAWKRYFPVLHIGERLVVRASWRRYRAKEGEVVLDLDPGMAFGTGQHATTRMCLEALERRVTPGARVLDVGCGSGILAIAAARLGAARVDGIDTDVAAVRATRENAGRNGVEGTVRVAEGSLGEAWPFAEPAADRYDLVLANLSSRLVRELAPSLVETLAPEGVALVSGLVAEQEASCVEALEGAGGRLLDRRVEEDWVLLEMGRWNPEARG